MNQCVIDASYPASGDIFRFIPVEGDLLTDAENAVLEHEAALVGDEPPFGFELVAILHPDGAEAVNEYCEANAEALERLRKRLEA